MKLYSAALSLFGRKVEIALRENGLAYDRVLVPFSQTKGYAPRDPVVMEVNPKGQVPVLIDGDLRLYDSTLIVEYLDERYPDIRLLPDEPAARARCRLLDLFADEILLVSVRALMHRTSPREAFPDAWDRAEAETGAAEVALAAHHADLDRKLAGRSFLLDDFSAADIAVFMTVLYGQRLGGPVLDPHPSLKSWYEGLKGRPVFADLVAEIVAADRELSAPVPGGRT